MPLGNSQVAGIRNGRRQVAGVYATQLLPFYDAQAVSLFGAFESVVYDMTG